MDDIAYEIKEESPVLYAAIRHVTQAAFAPMSFSSGAEPNIIETLRAEGDLSLSLVAIGQGGLLGHCAFHRSTFQTRWANGMLSARSLFEQQISARESDVL